MVKPLQAGTIITLFPLLDQFMEKNRERLHPPDRYVSPGLLQINDRVLQKL